MSTPTGAAAPAAPASTPTPSTPADTSKAAPETAASPEEVAALEAEDKAAPASKAEKVAALKKKYQLKVDGQDEELELDLSNDEEVRKHLQMSKAAYKRMQEMAEYKKNVQSFFEQLKSNPLSILGDPSLGLDLKQMAQSVLNNELEEMKKSPEQKAAETAQKELEKVKKQYEDEKKSREQADFARLQEQAARQIDQDIAGALEGSGLPKTPYTVKKMAEVMLMAVENGIDINAKEVVPMIKKQITQEIREMFGAAPDDSIEEFLGQDGISRLRKRALARMKAAPKTPEQVKATGAEVKKPEAQKPVEKINAKDFFKKLGKF